jgi:hypothetical protein
MYVGSYSRVGDSMEHEWAFVAIAVVRIVRAPSSRPRRINEHSPTLPKRASFKLIAHVLRDFGGGCCDLRHTQLAFGHDAVVNLVGMSDVVFKFSVSLG